MNIIGMTKMKMGNMLAFLIVISMVSIIANSVMFPSALAAPTVGTNTNITSESHGQNEPNIAINPLHNTLQPMDIHIAVGANDYRSGRSVPGLYTSTDLTTWTFHSVSKPTYDAYGNAVLDYDSAGNLYYAYMAFEVDVSGNGYDAAIYVSKSADEGVTWAFYTRVSSLGSGNDPYNDRPWLAVDKANNYVYVTWTLWHGRGASCLGSDIMFARSTDGGATFSAPLRISSSYSPSGQQRQWSQIAIGPSGEIYVTWRRFGGTGITRAIFIAKSTDNGASFGPEAIVIQAPDFVPTDYLWDSAGLATCAWPKIAVGPEGNVYIAWHQWIADYNRDLNFLRSTTGGTSWSPKMTIASNAKDQFWPTLAVSPTGRVDAVWYDRRDDSNNRLINLYYTASLDQGVTFDPAIAKVTTASSDTSVPCTGSLVYFGDYIDLAETSDGAALAVWTDTRAGNQEIFIASMLQAPPGTQVWPADEHGNIAIAYIVQGYLVNQEAYVKGAGLPASTPVTIYIMPSGAGFLPGNAVASATSLTEIDGDLPLTFVWSPPLTLGSYDIWVDVNQNNALDGDDYVGGDFMVVGFSIVPFYPYCESTATGTGAVYLASDPGTITDFTAVGEATLPTDGKPQGVTFLHGFFSFTIEGLTPGATVTVYLQLPSAVPIGSQYWKYQEGIGWFSIPIGSDDGDSVITITLTDGGSGDADTIANGLIVDPGGLALVTDFNVIPEVPLGTLMTFLSMITALAGFLGLKRYWPKLSPQ